MIEGLGAVQRLMTEKGPDGSLSVFSNAAPAASMPVSGASFADALQGLASQTVARLDHAQQVSLGALQGEADIREVVDAVMSAEQSLQAAIAIRDKIVTAYLEISRMAI